MPGRSLLWRLLETFLALWGLTSLVFLLSHSDPTGPAELMLPDRTELAGTFTSTPKERAQALRAIEHRLGLDLPLFYIGRETGPVNLPHWRWHGGQNQYHRWLWALLHGDLGVSLRTGQPVTAQLLAALRYTLPLTGTALVLAVGLALLLGQCLASTRRWWHAPARTGLVALHSVPLFVLAMGLPLLVANPELLDWLPVHGLAPEEGDTDWGQAIYLVLPIISLVLAALPALALQLETALRRELRTSYATTARAKGMSESQVVRYQALRNAILPTLTQFTELVPVLVSGALVVEKVYSLPGAGRLLADAAVLRDYPLLVGGLLLLGAVRLGALLLADLLYSWADPRIRWPS